MGTQLLLHGGLLFGYLLLQLGIVLAQLLELQDVAGAPLQAVPRRDLLPVLRSLARHLAGVLRIVPDPRLGELCV